LFESNDVKLLRILTDLGREYCGNPERSRVRALFRGRGHRPLAHQNQKLADNGICERFHKTMLNEFYRIAFNKKVYRSIDGLQADLDGWICEYNEARPHQGLSCLGKTPMHTFPLMQRR
jgi:transposase InsO family protein